MKIELHLLQNVPPSCLNRDDTNTPKDCQFGGVRRARISSQCLKRAIRTDPRFETALKDRLGYRTRNLADELIRRLKKAPQRESAAALPIVQQFIAEAKLGQPESAKANRKTKTVAHVSPAEIDTLATHLNDNWAALDGAHQADTEKKANAAKTKLTSALQVALKGWKLQPDSVDIALFGRMLAETDNVDAACHVAHAISTNRVAMEMDYWVACEDFPAVDETGEDPDEQGAALLGTQMFNSSCFYRYLVLDTDELVSNLKDDRKLAYTASRVFLHTAVTASPTGKQASTAAYAPPALIFLVARSAGVPLSMANAFEKPARPTHDSGLVAESIKQFCGHWDQVHAVYGQEGIEATGLCIVPDIRLPESWSGQDRHADGPKNTLVEAIDRVLVTAFPGEAGTAA